MATCTLNERRSKLYYIHGVLLGMRARGEIDTTNPRLMAKKEIDALTVWMKSKGLSLGYRYTLWKHLARLLDYSDNGILRQLQRKGQWNPPKQIHKPIYVKDDDWFRDVVARLAQRDDWRSKIVLAAAAIHYHSGIRVKELRLARLSDLDTARWTLTIEHPKGEGAWAAPGERIAIFPSLRPFILDYFDQRGKRLTELGLGDAEPLFPNENGRFYSEAGWRGARMKVFRVADIDGDYRVLRSSFGQKLIDAGATLQDVSRALRHSSTVVTQKHYCNVRAPHAWSKLEAAWERPNLRVVNPG